MSVPWTKVLPFCHALREWLYAECSKAWTDNMSTLLGCVALVRGGRAIVIKLSRERSVGRSVCLSSALWKNGGSDPDAVQTGPGMRQVVGFGDRSTVRDTFGGEFGARHCPQGPIGRTCATAPRRGPLAKLLWADLLLDAVAFTYPSLTSAISCSD